MTWFFLWYSNNIDRNGVKKWKTHIHKDSGKDNTGIGSMKISDTPYFSNPPLLWEKPEPLIPFKNSTQPPPHLFYKGGGGPTMASHAEFCVSMSPLSNVICFYFLLFTLTLLS